MLKRVLITGPESSGKSTLARQLAWAMDGIYVPEYARQYLYFTDGEYAEADLVKILDGQLQAEESARQLSQNSLLVCDTGPFVMHVWSEVKYQRVAQEIIQAVTNADYDLVLLCKPDLPWQVGPLREHPDQTDREVIFNKYVEMLEQSEKKYRLIEGSNRTEQALNYMIERRNLVR